MAGTDDIPPVPRLKILPTKQRTHLDFKSDQPFKKKSNQPQEEPFKYLDQNHEELVRIYDFYEISQGSHETDGWSETQPASL